MQECKLQVKLLGGFSVQYEGEELSMLLPRAQTLWKLFRYLLINVGKAISTESLIDVLWKEVDTENPRKALQNLMYRLRKILPSTDEDGEEYIITQHRTYMWNPQARVWVDAWEFDAMAKKIKGTPPSGSKYCDLCRAACDAYGGECMEDIQDEKWVETLAVHYRRQYFDCLNTLLDVLQEMRRFDDVVSLCTKVLQTNMFEEHYHALLIRGMLAQGNRYGALMHYRSITSTLLRELGVEPSEELYAAGRSIYEGGIRMQPDLGVVIDDLRSAAGTMGPMVCEQDIFRYIFQFHERKIRRDMTPCMMVMYTIQSKSRALTDEEMFHVMVALKRACIMTLRRSDILTQQSNSQLLLLLPGANDENTKAIMERIQRKYELLCHNPSAQIIAQLRSMTAEQVD